MRKLARSPENERERGKKKRNIHLNSNHFICFVSFHFRRSLAFDPFSFIHSYFGKWFSAVLTFVFALSLSLVLSFILPLPFLLFSLLLPYLLSFQHSLSSLALSPLWLSCSYFHDMTWHRSVQRRQNVFIKWEKKNNKNKAIFFY